MSTDVPSQAVPPSTDAQPDRRRPRRRGKTLAAAAVLVVLVIAAVIVLTDPFGDSHSGEAAGDARSAPLQTVRRGALSSQVNASGTLTYAAHSDGSPYQVINQSSGTLTALPRTGHVAHCGRVLYRVANKPVVLLCGHTPAYRSLSEGDRDPDVRQLNANLVHLGYAERSQIDPSSDYFGWETAAALERLQDELGVTETGSLDLGRAVFLPGPVRITKTTATLGTTTRPGAPIAEATSTRRQVQVNLDASQQAGVKVGNKTVITLPDNHTTPGTVSRIGTVASTSGSSSSSSSQSESSTAKIPVTITLKHAAAARGLDQAPVQVQITVAGVKDALIVPVSALLARSGDGRYAVETVDARGLHHLVPVTLGLFDDADGLVQVTSSKLAAGQRVVVPST